MQLVGGCLYSFYFVFIALTATQFNRYKGSIYLVFDFCEHDLAGLLSNTNVKFTLAEIKKVMQMLLNGLYYIHRNKVSLLQRDLNLKLHIDFLHQVTQIGY